MACAPPAKCKQSHTLVKGRPANITRVSRPLLNYILALPLVTPRPLPRHVQAFVKAGLGSMLTIGTDDCCGGEYSIAKQMVNDAVLNASYDIFIFTVELCSKHVSA